MRPRECAVPFALVLARALHARAYVRGAFPLIARRQLPHRNRLDRDVQIDAVDERPGETCSVALHVRRGTGAALRRIAGAPAGTGIHRADKRESGRAAHASRGSRNDDMTVLERLSHSAPSASAAL